MQQVEEVNVVDEGLAKGDGFYFKNFDPTTNQKIPFKDINCKKLKKTFSRFIVNKKNYTTI